MASVVDTIVPMIRSYPSLYPNRKKALEHLFSHYGTKWVDGELVHDNPADYDLPEGHDFRTDLDEYEGEGNESLWFMHAFENAKLEVCVANAERLAAYTGHLGEDRINGGWMHTNHFEDMPEDVTEDWFEAAKELAFEIIVRFKDVPETDHFYQHKLGTFKNAQRFLLRHGLLNNEAREKRIAELRKELEELEAQDES